MKPESTDDKVRYREMPSKKEKRRHMRHGNNMRPHKTRSRDPVSATAARGPQVACPLYLGELRRTANGEARDETSDQVHRTLVRGCPTAKRPIVVLTVAEQWSRPLEDVLRVGGKMHLFCDSVSARIRRYGVAQHGIVAFQHSKDSHAAVRVQASPCAIVPSIYRTAQGRDRTVSSLMPRQQREKVRQAMRVSCHNASLGRPAAAGCRASWP
jgi:hypothetical protein